MLTLGLALALLVGGAAPAHAGFLIAPIVAAIGLTGTAATIATAVGTAALAVGVSFVANKIFGPKPQKQAQADIATPKTAGGIELDVRIDADVPQSLIVGRAVTAGSLVYQETYGDNNQNLVEIISIADHPCDGLVKVFVDDQEATLTDTGGNRGSTVDGYSEKLALRFFDGSQSAADAFTVSALGSHDERPWTADMVGTGVTYVRTHSIYDRELVPGPLRYRFVVDGIRLYDPRLDSTVEGGSGSHRWDDLSTHEHSSNLALIAYNILRGIRVLDADGEAQHFYGLENTPEDNLPLDEWFAAMNVCDETVDGESRYHGGAEIEVSREPLEVIREIAKACDGRLVEIGGAYKFYVGEPGLSVATFDDGAIRADSASTFRPVLPLEQRISHVTGKYTSPGDGWIPKVAPPRTASDTEEAIGRRVSADLDAPFVQSGNHMQRLMKQILLKAQKQRRHVLPLPPEMWGLEPGDVITWTSTRNGYDAKLFEIDAVEDFHDLSLVVSVTEIDEADYDWDADEDLIPEADGSLVVNRPAPKVVSGFAAEGLLLTAPSGARRPAIEISWTDPEDDDIEAVQFEVWISGDSQHKASGRSDEVTAGSIVYTGDLHSLTDYQVRARFISFNGYATSWSLPIEVTTPDARLTLAEVDAIFAARMAQLDITQQASLARILLDVDERLDQLASDSTQLVARLEEQTQLSSVSHARVVTAVRAQLTDPDTGLSATAKAIAALEAQVTDDLTAVAQAFNAVFVENPQGNASAMFRIIAEAAPSGVAARVALEAKAEDAEFGADSAALYLDVIGGLGSVITAEAERFRIQTGAGGKVPFTVMGNDIFMSANVSIDGSLLVDGTVTADHLAAGSITADKIEAGTIVAENIEAGGLLNPIGGENDNPSGTILGRIQESTPFTTLVSVPGVVVDDPLQVVVALANAQFRFSSNTSASAITTRVILGSNVIATTRSRAISNAEGDVDISMPSLLMSLPGVVPLGTYTAEFQVAFGPGFLTWGDHTGLDPVRCVILAPRR